MIRIDDFQKSQLEQLQHLMNSHIDSLIPGWVLPAEYIASRLRANPSERADTWVAERSTIVALDGDQIQAAVHLLRYQEDAPVEIKASFEWILAWPNEPAAANSLIAAAHDRLDRWQVRLEGIGIDLPIPVCVGIPDVWPHMSELFEKGGYAPDRDSYEAVYGGSLDHIPPPGHPPIEGLEIKRTMGKFGTRFTALLDGKEVSRCECYADLTQGGRLPALANWSELSEIETADEWRNKGIGAWVVKHAIHWLRLAGCDRCVFSVGPEDEEAGAARFYSRFGWEPFVRERKWWTRREL